MRGRFICTCSPAGMDGIWGALTAMRALSGQKLLRQLLVGIRGRDLLARADVRQRAAAGHGQLHPRRPGGRSGRRA